MISIITPTLGRKSLIKTCNSIDNQTSEEYEHIVIFDGINPCDLPLNKKRKVFKTDKLGGDSNIHGIAGEVRNFGFNHCKGNYIGFVDDDDTLDKDYVKIVHEDFENGYDFIIYTMSKNGTLYPVPNIRTIELGQMGISFVFKKEILNQYNLKFENSNTEDYLFLKKLESLGLKFLISSKVLYFINN